MTVFNAAYYIAIGRNFLKCIFNKNLHYKNFFGLCLLIFSGGASFASTQFLNIRGENAPFTGSVIQFLGDHKGAGYIFGKMIFIGGSEDGWKIPVGSYFCMVQDKRGFGWGIYMYRFKVKSYSTTKNSIVLAGTAFHSWITGYTPDLTDLGWKSVDDMKTTEEAINYCKTGK